jgi:hypothetical protein
MSYGTLQIEKMTTESGYSLGAGNASSFKNRLINGNMAIDQRNAGAVQTSPASNTYALDRWKCNVGGGGFNVQQNAGSVTPPVGFKNYYGVTSTSTSAASNYSIRQLIEGFNTADLMYGTADAKTTTLSFWIYSSLTGTFGGAIQNESGNRSYVYSYTINAANTWQYVTATIPGDTGGAWTGATNGTGIVLFISYSVAAGQAGAAGSWTGNDYRAPTGQVNVVGTNGATFYITGVQLEVGTVATSFDFRSITTELSLCQRYFQKTYPQSSAVGNTSGSQTGALFNSNPATNTYPNIGTWNFATVMRANPTVTTYNPTTGSTSTFIGDGVSYSPIGVTAIGERSVAIYGANVSIGLNVFLSVHATASAEL